MKKITLTLALLMGLFSLPSAHAALPVVDTTAIARLVQQIQEMKKQYDMLKQQYDELIQTKNAVTGSYGVSLLENGPLAELSRRAVPGSWQEIVSLQQSGSIPGFSQGLNSFQKLFPTVEGNLLSQDPNNRNAQGYKLSTDSARGAFASAEAIYNKIQDRLKTIEALTQEIDRTDNVKHATDLNSRIAAENGFLNVDIARLNSIQLSLQAVLQNNQNQATANHAEFFGTPAK